MCFCHSFFAFEVKLINSSLNVVRSISLVLILSSTQFICFRSYEHGDLWPILRSLWYMGTSQYGDDLHMSYQFSQQHERKRLSLLLFMSYLLCQKVSVHTSAGYFWTSILLYWSCWTSILFNLYHAAMITMVFYYQLKAWYHAPGWSTA